MPFLGKTPAQIVDPEVDIDGGSIDGATIGATSASAATVTTFTSTGIDDNSTSTAITIDASENVGIGTFNPASKFAVSNGGAEGYELNADSGLGDGGTLTRHYNRSASSYVRNTVYAKSHDFSLAGSSGSDAFEVNYGGNNVLYARYDGNVGIGEDSPETRLHIKSTTPAIVLEDSDSASAIGSSNRLLFRNSSGTYSAQIGNDPAKDSGVNFTLGTNVAYGVGIFTNNLTRMVIDTGGRHQYTSNTYSYGAQNYVIKSQTSAGNMYLGNIQGTATLSSNGHYYGGSLRKLDSGKQHLCEVQVTSSGTFSVNQIRDATAGSTATASSKLSIDENGVQKNGGATYGAMQRLAFSKTPAASGTWFDIAFTGYQATLRVTGMLHSPTTSLSSGGATRQMNLDVVYGNGTTSNISNHAFGGNFTNLEFRYLNTGGSQSHILQARATYTGSAPHCDFTIDGWSYFSIYAI